jgi:hypothetical protein
MVELPRRFWRVASTARDLVRMINAPEPQPAA